MTTGVEGCWAKSLGDCAGKISREHLISQCFWAGADSVYVEGLHWCLGETRLVGLTGLTGKILCEKHNSELGGMVDPVAAQAVSVIEDAIRLLNVRRNLRRRHYNVMHFRIDGLTFERWFLKTLINLSYRDQHNIFAECSPDRIAAERLVEIAFGRAEWPEYSGLWLAAGQPGTQQNVEKRLKFHSYTHGQSLVGSMFSFCGYDFYLNLQSVRPNFAQFNIRQTLHHIRAFKYTVPDDKLREVLSHVIHLDW